MPKPHAKNDYFVTTSNVKVTQRQVSAARAEQGDGTAPERERKDFISRNFRYISMCDWYPGMRFMVRPTQKDLVVRTFADARTGNMMSTRSLTDSILVYEGHANPSGSLHDQVVFHLEGDASRKIYFEVPTATFDDYCYGQHGVPSLAYLGDVDLAIDSLVGKKVRVMERYLFQDSEVQGGNFKSVDIGDAKRGTIMTISKVGVGTRDFPVKIVVKEPDKDGLEGQEFFQLVAISRTNCSLRDEDFEKSDNLPHTFKGSFELLDDRMAVTPELQAWAGKQVFTFFDTEMTDETTQKPVRIAKMTPFTVTEIFGFGDNDMVALTLKGKRDGKTYTKQVSSVNTKVTGKEEVLNELFIEGDPDNLKDIRVANLPLIQQGKVKNGFTEAEVRMALGEPSDITRTVAGSYQWIYQYVDTNRPFRAVKFSSRTKKVIQVSR